MKIIGFMIAVLVAGSASAAPKVLTFQEATDLTAKLSVANKITCNSDVIPIEANFVLEGLKFTADATTLTIFGDASGQYYENATAVGISTVAYIDYQKDGDNFLARDGQIYTNQMTQEDLISVTDTYQIVQSNYFDGYVFDASKYAQDANGKVTGAIEYLEVAAGDGFVKLESTYEVSAVDHTVSKVKSVVSSVDLVNVQTLSYTNLSCQ